MKNPQSLNFLSQLLVSQFSLYALNVQREHSLYCFALTFLQQSIHGMNLFCTLTMKVLNFGLSTFLFY